MRSSRPLRAALLATVACLVGCDHATKVVAHAALRNAAPVVIVPGLVDLRYAENRDFAFDLLARLSLHPPLWTITLMPLVSTLVVVIVWLRRRASTWSEQAGFALVTGGAIGNAADRLLRGHVVDFIHVHFWPIFNFADALIVVGVGLLLVGVRRPSPRALP